MKKTVFYILLFMLGLCVLFIYGNHVAYQKEIQQKIAIHSNYNSHSAPQKIDFSAIYDSPEPLRKYLTRALPADGNMIKMLKVAESGDFRMKLDSSLTEQEGWKKISANQYFTTENQSFFWHAKLALMPGIKIEGWDLLHEGKGNMYWKILSTFSLVDSKHPQLDQAGLFRYLAEAPLFPTALLPSGNLQWEAIDSSKARAIIKYENIKASAIFHFNDKSEISLITTMDKIREIDVYSPYRQTLSNYSREDGFLVPHYGEASWELSFGEFKYGKFTFKNFEYKY